MEELSINQIIKRLRIAEPSLSAWAEQQGCKFPVEDSQLSQFTSTDREALKNEICRLVEEMNNLTNFASDLLTLPSKAARRSAANLKHWQENHKRQRLSLVGKSDPRAIVEPAVIDKNANERPYDVFSEPSINMKDPAKEHLTICYHVKEISNALSQMFFSAGSVSLADKKQTVGRVLRAGGSIEQKSQLYLIYLDDYLNFCNKNAPSELNPFCLSACRFCHDVIYPAAIARTERLYVLLDRLQRKESKTVLLKELEHQGNVTGLPGITAKGEKRKADVFSFFSSQNPNKQR
jgi:hypothetical protein